MLSGDPVVGYIRVSTDEQGQSGLGLDAQRAAIEEECQRRGWLLIACLQDVASGGSVSVKRRPQLAAAIRMCETGEAKGLVAAKLDRVSRSVLDFMTLLERARSGRRRWNLRILDMDLDLATAQGEALAGMLAVFAQLERRLISERTRAAMQAAKRRGKTVSGPTIDHDTARRIRAMVKGGASYLGVAKQLNDECIPTARGGKWYACTIRQLVLKAA